MNDDTVFRWVLLVALLLFMPVGLYHRFRAHTGEPLDRRQEGWFVLVGLRVSAGFAAAGYATWFFRPAWLAWTAVATPFWLRWIGVGLCLGAGMLLTWTFRSLGRNLTDTVVTRREHTLVTHGPYRWVRHPFYLTGALGLLGSTLVAANALLPALGAIPMAFLVIRTRKEESNLLARFGDAYLDYMQHPGRFLPRI